MFEIIRLDGRNITYKDSKEIARVRVIALAEDIVQQRLFSDADQIDAKALPSLADFEELKAKITVFERRVRQATHRVHLFMLSDPRVFSYVLKDTETDKIIGVSEWELPIYADQPFKVSLLRKLRVLYLRCYYFVLDLLSPTTSIHHIYEKYQKIARQEGLVVDNIESSIAELSTKPRKELEEMAYPADLTYFLRLFAVRTDYHGCGMGKKLLLESFDRLRQEAVKPPMFDGPAKLLWQAAPLAKGFYSKLGCSIAKTTTVEEIDHTVFFMNID